MPLVRSERSWVRVPPLILKYRYMELIYFISGILITGVVYGVNLLRHVKSSHTELLAKYQSQSNISSIRYADMEEKIDGMKLYVNDIQDKLKKDSYAETTTLARNLDEYGQRFNKLESKVLLDINRTEKSFDKTFTELQTLKNQVKALGQDPNFLSRY